MCERLPHTWLCHGSRYLLVMWSAGARNVKDDGLATLREGAAHQGAEGWATRGIQAGEEKFLDGTKSDLRRWRRQPSAAVVWPPRQPSSWVTEAAGVPRNRGCWSAEGQQRCLGGGKETNEGQQGHKGSLKDGNKALQRDKEYLASHYLMYVIRC